MHICFIVDNSLTMLQKTSNSQLSIFDHVKHCLQTVVKNVFRNMSNTSLKQSHDMIHLFVTSSTQPVSSYVDNHQMHLIHQIKNLQCTIPTFPAEAIESALYHVGKFRCLNQSQTFLGYRQGTIFEPAIIFYITDNSNSRQIQKINQKIIQNKFHLRAEYKFITIKYCSASPTQTNLNNLQKFRAFVEKQKETLMIEEVMKKVNGQLFHVYSGEEIVNLVQNVLCKSTPTLTMGLSNKEYKIYNKEIVKLQFPTPAAQEQHINRLKSLRLQNIYTKDSSTSLIDFFVDTVPLQSRTKIPLPHQLTPKHLSETKIIIDQFQPLKYCVDFTKEYVGSLCQTMKFFFNIYQLSDNKQLMNMLQDLGQQKKFPLFYERKKNQYLIGYLRLFFQMTQNRSMRPAAQLHFSFSNFTNLNANIRSFMQRNPSSQQYFQNYISTLPIFYHKFLKFYLPNLNIVLSPQSEQSYQNIHTKPIGITNVRFYEQRLTEKKTMQIEQKDNFDQHQRKISQCCAVYSDQFQEWEKERSRFYSQMQNEQIQNDTQIAKFFRENITKLTSIKPTLGIYDYLTPQQIKSTSIKRQLQKYGHIRRNDQQMDQLVGGLFGNPFRKINKKVKLHDQAESVWVQPEEVGKLKELLNKQMQVFYQMHTQLTQGQKDEMENVMKMDSIYDKLAAVKGIIADALKNVQYLEKTTSISSSSNLQSPSNQVSDKQSSKSQSNEIFEQNQISGTLNNGKKSSHDSSKIIEQQTYKEVETNSDNHEPQEQKDKSENSSSKPFDPRIRHQQKAPAKVQNTEKTQQNNSKIPQIIDEVNSKFPMIKSVVLQIPVHLVHNDLYLKNKSIITQALLNHFN